MDESIGGDLCSAGVVQANNKCLETAEYSVSCNDIDFGALRTLAVQPAVFNDGYIPKTEVRSREGISGV